MPWSQQHSTNIENLLGNNSKTLKNTKQKVTSLPNSKYMSISLNNVIQLLRVTLNASIPHSDNVSFRTSTFVDPWSGNNICQKLSLCKSIQGFGDSCSRAAAQPEKRKSNNEVRSFHKKNK